VNLNSKDHMEENKQQIHFSTHYFRFVSSVLWLNIPFQKYEGLDVKTLLEAETGGGKETDEYTSGPKSSFRLLYFSCFWGVGVGVRGC